MGSIGESAKQRRIRDKIIAEMKEKLDPSSAENSVFGNIVFGLSMIVAFMPLWIFLYISYVIIMALS